MAIRCFLILFSILILSSMHKWILLLCAWPCILCRTFLVRSIPLVQINLLSSLTWVQYSILVFCTVGISLKSLLKHFQMIFLLLAHCYCFHLQKKNASLLPSNSARMSVSWQLLSLVSISPYFLIYCYLLCK